MEDNLKAIVAAGYDRITERYQRLVDNGGYEVRDKYLAIIDAAIPKGARILELGCGSGDPMTRTLSASYDVTGVDISANQLALARTNAPSAGLLRADMARLPIADARFDACAAFYSMTHVPRTEHPALLAEVCRVLGPRALIVLTMGASDNPNQREDDWLGAPMFFSHFDGETNTALVRDAGFDIQSSQVEMVPENGVPVRFRWIVARRSS